MFAKVEEPQRTNLHDFAFCLPQKPEDGIFFPFHPDPDTYISHLAFQVAKEMKGQRLQETIEKLFEAMPHLSAYKNDGTKLERIVLYQEPTPTPEFDPFEL